MATRVKTKKRRRPSRRPLLKPKRRIRRKVQRKKSTHRYQQAKSWVCICGAQGDGSTTLSRHENTRAHAVKMQQDLDNKTGFFAPENVRRIAREGFASGRLISTDDDMRAAGGLAPWSREEAERERSSWKKKAV